MTARIAVQLQNSILYSNVQMLDVKMSYVIYHMSDIICHTVCPMSYNMSFVGCLMSYQYIICHKLDVICQMS